MRQLFHIYVVLEDTVELRFTMRHCMRMEARNSSHTYFSCPNEEPLYVLTRKCSSEYYQASSACCKVEQRARRLFLPGPFLDGCHDSLRPLHAAY